MVLYNDKKEPITFKTSERIGGEFSGNIYKISPDECLKVYKNGQTIDKEILMYIKNLYLKNFYEIYEFYNDKKGNFKAHTMKYYKPEEIDILTMPTEYTLDNLFNLEMAVAKLTRNNIQIEDTHTGNIIMDRNNITIIDADLYSFSHFYTDITLRLKNVEKLEYLMRELFAESLTKYHIEYQNYKTIELIKNTFKLFTPYQIENTFRELSKYKYPIDYIKKKTKHI